MQFTEEQMSKLFLVGLALLLFGGWWFTRLTPERAIAELADPDELASLRERGANPRVNEIVYWLHQIEADGANLTNVLASVLRRAYRPEEPRELVQAALLRNYTIAHRLGLLTEAHDNLHNLESGNSATICNGPYRGEKAEVDHIVPVSLAPEAGNCLANLELMPASLNRRKSNRVNSRHLALAEKLHAVGWLTAESLERVRAQVKLKPTDIRDPVLETEVLYWWIPGRTTNDGPDTILALEPPANHQTGANALCVDGSSVWGARSRVLGLEPRLEFTSK